MFIAPANAFEWADLWSSAEQRARSNYEKQQYDALIEAAPDANWQGLGEYRKGDYTAAAKSFAEQRKLTEEAGLSEEAVQAMYNQANAHVFEENYPAALKLFNEILDVDPQHENAKHNRDITQQLIEQEQQQSDQQGEQSDNDQNSADQQGEESGEGEGSEQQPSEQSQDGESQSTEDSADSNEDQNASASAPADDQAGETTQDQTEQDQAAAAAMQAEQQREANAGQPAEGEAVEDVPVSAQPLTEREQANEQWLRQIPDDPAGLLERKLQNRHLTDFPKIRDSDEPW